MNNELALYTASAGIVMTPSASDVPAMMQYNRALKPREAEKVVQAVNAGLYDMAAEYIWSRTISILKKDIMQFGDDFVAEMLDRPYGDIDSISEYEVISLAELARRLGKSPQAFNAKLKRESFTIEELEIIADAVNAKFLRAFELSSGDQI